MVFTDAVTIWIHQIKGGERSPIAQLFGRYFQRLVLLARARLKKLPGLAAYDEDVALSAFKSLCLGVERGCFPQLNDRDDLWRLLATITVRKAIDLQRRQHCRPRGSDDGIEELLCREPTPELAEEMAEEYRRLLDRLDDECLRTIALLKVEGLSNEEIAGRLACGLRSVERKLHRIRVVWALEVEQ
jgi:DNA-directed RNA polymerase specialized sigma24 family protein